MKLPHLFKYKKVFAATARRASAASAGMDFDGIPEPNMKLSRALLIVLLLHVVAVSGIIAFNAIKTRESSYAPAVPANSENKPAAVRAIPVEPAKPTPAVAQKQNSPHNDSKPSHSPVKDEHPKTPSSSGKTYTVKKGDNPVKIAKKLKVSYDDLIALNHIRDPRKLQVGQKLQIPANPAKPSEKKKKK